MAYFNSDSWKISLVKAILLFPNCGFNIFLKWYKLKLIFGLIGSSLYGVTLIMIELGFLVEKFNK